MSGNRFFCTYARLTIFLIVALGMVGCGREAPYFAPARLTVDSDPQGAAILLNGDDTGEITPFTFAALDNGSYEVSVSLDGFVSSPGSELVDLAPLAERELSFTLLQTGLMVASNPDGAAIFIDGQDTGQTTPATLAGVSSGAHTLELRLAGHHVFPAQLTIDLPTAGILELPADTFLIRSDRTALCEGFTNIFCVGCPELTASLHDMQADPEYGPDRVVILKYSMQWPLVTDVHYQYNTSENDARLFYYGFTNISALPTLYVHGRIAGTAGNPSQTQGIKDAVDAYPGPDPGFLIDVTADLSGQTVPVTVTLTALDSTVDLGGKTLRVSLVQSEVNYPEPPVAPNLGETTFYWVFRDQSPDLTDLGAIEPGSPQQFQVNLSRDDWPLETIEVIAYVQDDNDKAIIQAGSTMVTPVAQAGPATFFEGMNP